MRPPLSSAPVDPRPIDVKRREDATTLRKSGGDVRAWLKKIGIDDPAVTHVTINIPLDGVVKITIERNASEALVGVEPPDCLTDVAPPEPVGTCRDATPATPAEIRRFAEGGPSPEEAARKARLTAPPVREASSGQHQRFYPPLEKGGG